MEFRASRGTCSQLAQQDRAEVLPTVVPALNRCEIKLDVGSNHSDRRSDARRKKTRAGGTL